MLEQFHPTEVVELTRAGRGSTASPACMAADHFQPWVPAAGPGRRSSGRAGRRSASAPRATSGPGVTCPSFRLAPGDGRPGRGDARGDVPGPLLARARRRARRSTSTSSAATGPRRRERINRMFEAIEIIKKLFAASRRQGRQARGHVLQDGDRPGCGRMPEVAAADLRRHRRADHRQEDRQARRRPHHRRRAAGEDRRPVRASSTRARARPARTPTTMPKVLQLHLSWAPTDEEALANAMTEWPNGGMKFPKAGHPLAVRLRADGQAGARRRTSRAGW